MGITAEVGMGGTGDIPEGRATEVPQFGQKLVPGVTGAEQFGHCMTEQYSGSDTAGAQACSDGREANLDLELKAETARSSRSGSQGSI